MPDRESWAEERAKSLEPRLSTVTVVVPPAVASTEGLVVERNGVAVGRGLWGEATYVDGGKQRVAAKAPGRRPWSTEVDVGPERATARVEVPALSAAGANAAPRPGASGDDAPSDGDSTAASEPTDGSAQLISGAVVAALGLGGLVAGIVVGVDAKSSYDSSGDEHCTDLGCDQAGVDAGEDARAQGDIATALFAIGGAALVAGVVTMLTVPSSEESSGTTTATLALDLAPVAAGAGLRLRGRW
jgi:hypothetical protein